MARVMLSDKQFERLERETRRELLRQLMAIETPRYKYTFGVLGRAWVIRRYDKNFVIEGGRWADDYVAEVVDSWL